MKLATAPTASEEARRDTIDILQRLLAEAEAGEIESIIIIAKRVDGFWFHEQSSVTAFPDAIGRLEIVKASWIEKFRQGDG